VGDDAEKVRGGIGEESRERRNTERARRSDAQRTENQVKASPGDHADIWRIRAVRPIVQVIEMQGQKAQPFSPKAKEALAILVRGRTAR